MILQYNKNSVFGFCLLPDIVLKTLGLLKWSVYFCKKTLNCGSYFVEESISDLRVRSCNPTSHCGEKGLKVELIRNGQ